MNLYKHSIRFNAAWDSKCGDPPMILLRHGIQKLKKKQPMTVRFVTIPGSLASHGDSKWCTGHSKWWTSSKEGEHSSWKVFFHQGSTRDARPKVWKNLLSILWQRGPSLTDSWPVQLDQNLVQGKCEEIGKLSQQKYLPARPDGFFFVQWNLKVTMRFWRSDKSCQLGKPGEPERAGFVRPRSHGEKFFIRNGVR